MNIGPVAERWAKVRLAHEAVMLDDAQAMLRLDRERLKAHIKNTTGHQPPEGDDVVHIGDQIVNNIPPAKPGISALATAGILAAILVGVAGGALGLASFLRTPTPITQPLPLPDQPKPGGITNKTGKPVEIETRDIEAGQPVHKYRWRIVPDGTWSEWKGYDPAKGIGVP